MKNPKANPLERRAYSEFGEAATNAAATSRPDVPPNQQQLKVQASRKGRKGKTVTVVSGFQASSETLADLAKKLKNHCGAGGAIKEDTIEVQGDHAEKVQLFLAELGYKAKISGG
ncbi:MAG: translation initiation factor [Acaryochloridaceae cyanobacterium RU_4_10]|nr:translation initiation factor [Acaryochloridaceae cyanobacterium RU_4_10]